MISRNRGRPLRVGILGGGSAGYLAGLAFRIRRPDVEVTLIESSRVPPIGVGEGTTPIMVPFLHGYLGLDVEEFFAKVQPTWKLGVRFEWGPGDGVFQFPFDAHNLTESYRYTGDINAGSIGALLMDRRAGVHLQRADWSYEPVLRSIPYAYHLDNRRFVKYLKHCAARVGLHPVDALIVDAERADDGSVAGLIADDGTRFDFDLYVDCSGFSSRLLGGALESEFISYKSSLFTDSALVGDNPHEAGLGFFTVARTMNAGWCWSLPQIESDHRGYVFSSDFVDADEAEAEMRRVCPGLGDVRLLKFRPGRRTHWWKDNVVGLGNAYGFVEPLEATALHMVVREIAYVVYHLDDAVANAGTRDTLNDCVASLWDNLSGTLALHYKYNHRLDTPFWRAARADTDLGPIRDLVESKLRNGPAPRPVHDPGSGTLLGGIGEEIDLLLLGMRQWDPANVSPGLTPTEWHDHRATLDGCARRALSSQDSLELANTRPDMADPRGGRWYENVVSGLVAPIGPGATG